MKKKRPTPVDQSTVVSASGTCMLTGEHSVLYGHPAVVFALPHRIQLKTFWRQDDKIVLHSDLSNYQATTSNLPDNPKLSFPIAAIRHCLKHLKIRTGLDLSYHSEIPHNLGLGSSAAVVVVTVAALHHLCGVTLKKQQLWEISTTIVRQVQGAASGADVCGSVYGGICEFNTESGKQRDLPWDENLPLNWKLYHSGYKTSTPKVLAMVQKKYEYQPKAIETIYQQMATISKETIQHFIDHQWSMLGTCLDKYQGLMSQLGVSDTTLNHLIHELKQSKNHLGAKISGSGLGDCVIALSDDSHTTKEPILKDYLQIPVSVDYRAVQIL